MSDYAMIEGRSTSQVVGLFLGPGLLVSMLLAGTPNELSTAALGVRT